MNAMQNVDALIGKGIQDLPVLLRADFNVPLAEDGTITDPGRIVASLPTIRALVKGQAKLVILAHLGRPKGKVDPKFSLAPVAKKLAELLGSPVKLAKDVVGSDAKAKVAELAAGEVLLLENVRFEERETSKNDSERLSLAKEWVELLGKEAVFVSDGFGVLHRKQASVYDVATLLPGYVGYLVEAELKVLNTLTHSPARPYAVVLGGAKVSDKLGVIKALAPKVDTLVIVGGMAYTFLAAQGLNVGQSLLQEDQIVNAKEILDTYADIIHLPDDVVVTKEFAQDADSEIVKVDDIAADQMGMDIGPASVQKLSAILSGAKTIFWNGPAGVFEFSKFAIGTKGIATAIQTATTNGAVSVIGGGDSAAAVRAAGFPDDAFTHISTGGGASLEYLEGKDLPGITVLERS